jgi:hypothetical protein
MAKTYAWSNIAVHDGNKRSTVKPGTEVTAESLNTDEDGFNELLDSGAVRTEPWPKGLSVANPAGDSPNSHRLKQAKNQLDRIQAESRSDGGTVPEPDGNGEDDGDNGSKHNPFA